MCLLAYECVHLSFLPVYFSIHLSSYLLVCYYLCQSTCLLVHLSTCVNLGTHPLLSDNNLASGGKGKYIRASSVTSGYPVNVIVVVGQ